MSRKLVSLNSENADKHDRKWFRCRQLLVATCPCQHRILAAILLRCEAIKGFTSLSENAPEAASQRTQQKLI
eukprot:365661-Chlamydomonas_euryale.AAC.27